MKPVVMSKTSLIVATQPAKRWDQRLLLQQLKNNRSTTLSLLIGYLFGKTLTEKQQQQQP